MEYSNDTQYQVIGPITPISKVTTIITILTSILCAMMVVPYIFHPSYIREYPNMFIPFIGLCGFLLDIGFWIGMMFDYNPIHYPGAICITQWFFLGPFGVTALLLLFFYIFGIYEIVVWGKLGKQIAWRQKYIVIACFIIGFVCEMLIPLGFPFFTGEVFGASGPWCAIRSLLVLTVMFYTPCIPCAIAIIYMSGHIAYKVRKTTNAAEKTIHQGNGSTPQGSSMATEHHKHRMERKARLNRFYARISLFALIYSATTIGSFIKRVIELKTTNWRDVHTPNNPAMGISILLPLLACLQAVIFVSTPAIARFWRKEIPAAAMGRTILSRTDGDTTRDDRKQKGSITEIGTRLVIKSDIETTSP